VRATSAKDDRIHKQRDDLPPPQAKRGWASFFALEIDVPEDFLAEREDSPPQLRELLCWSGADSAGAIAPALVRGRGHSSGPYAAPVSAA
jgi:hypothetical protein